MLHLVVERLPAGASQPAVETQHAELRQDIDTLRLLLQSSEKTQQADLEQLRQWMGRMIRSKSTAAGSEG